MNSITEGFDVLEYNCFYISLFSMFLLMVNGFSIIYFFITIAIVFSGLFEHTFLKLKYILPFSIGALISDVILSERFIGLPMTHASDKISFVLVMSLIFLSFINLSYYIVKKINK